MAKVLAVQKAVGDRARIELASEGLDSADAFVRHASRTLEKYARYATLTEYKILPSLADGEKWGATFGVAALVGVLVLEHARRALAASSPLAARAIDPLAEYLRFLDALAKPGSGSVEMDALSGGFAVLSEAYGLVWADGDKLSLTVAGKRVYLHLLDAAYFVVEAAEAARKYGKSRQSQ